MRRFEVGRLYGLLLLACLVPAAASAQSSIAGLVTDATGGVLPGVTVEAASPALIEKARSVTTDGEGRYAIVDLRPGIYTVSFTLAGFNGVRREGITLGADTNVPINTEMRIGAVAETITVTGETPVVDLQSAARRETLNREQMEVLPTTRNPAQMLTMVPGVRAWLENGRSGVQGATENVFVDGRGLDRFETRWNVDGMDARTGNLDGLANLRLNDAMFEETTFTTFGSSIESSGGGVALNMIPRDGGNRLSGNFYSGGNLESFVSDNLSQELRDRGTEHATSLGPNLDSSVAIGGKIKRDRVWFYAGWRYQRTLQYQAELYDFEPGVRDLSNWWLAHPLPGWDQLQEKTKNHNTSLRITSQLSQGQKVTAFYDRTWNRDYFSDPTAYVWTPGNSLDYLGQLKYTNAVTNRFLLDAGLSLVSYTHNKKFSELVDFAPFTPGWYATVRREDLNTSAQLYQVYATADDRASMRRTFTANAIYVTGSHSLKAGVQVGDAWSQRMDNYNGHGIARFRDGEPDAFLANNQPSARKGDVFLDLGLFVNDTWAFKRLTVNGGLRLDRFAGGYVEHTLGAGRFVKERHVPRFEAPIENDIAPRVSVTYDLFGNAKTALKFGFGKYLENLGQRHGELVNPAYVATQTLDWNDTNGDKIPQDNELEDIRVLNSVLYNGFLGRTRHPDFSREYNLETSLGVQHELRPGLSAHVNFYRRQLYNRAVLDRPAISRNMYVPYDVTTPFGEVVTIYHFPTTDLLNAYGAAPLVYRTETNSDIDRLVYQGLELGFDGRLPGGARAFGGVTFQRSVNVSCASGDNPNTLRFCDESQYDIPFQPEFKVAAMQRFPGAIDGSVTWMSLAGQPLPVNWGVTRTLRYAADCKAPCRPGDLVVSPRLNFGTVTLRLVEPGQRFYDRYNDLAIGVSRFFQLPKGNMRLGINIFNALNGAAIIEEETSLVSVNYRRPVINQEPRSVHVTARYSF